MFQVAHPKELECCGPIDDFGVKRSFGTMRKKPEKIRSSLDTRRQQIVRMAACLNSVGFPTQKATADDRFKEALWNDLPDF